MKVKTRGQGRSLFIETPSIGGRLEGRGLGLGDAELFIERGEDNDFNVSEKV
jgi:hypothetical protein